MTPSPPRASSCRSILWLLPSVLDLAAVTGYKDLRTLKRYYHPQTLDLTTKLGDLE